MLFLTISSILLTIVLFVSEYLSGVFGFYTNMVSVSITTLWLIINTVGMGYIGESTKLLSTLNASILSMASDAAEDGKETRKQNRFMIWLAAGSLLLTALFSAWTYWDQSSDIKLRDLSEILSKNSKANTGLLEEIKRTHDIQQDELKAKILELETKVKTLENSKSKPQTVTTKQRPLPQ